ncbi:hypothetical protein AFK68_18740 [Hydrocoleum sp. CS-953]|nr:hypothetical protein AFK68_18740 [Hydrocoleum sp. CS-953]
MNVAGNAIIALGGTTTAEAIAITPTSNGNDLVQEILGRRLDFSLNRLKKNRYKLYEAIT